MTVRKALASILAAALVVSSAGIRAASAAANIAASAVAQPAGGSIGGAGAVGAGVSVPTGIGVQPLAGGISLTNILPGVTQGVSVRTRAGAVAETGPAAPAISLPSVAVESRIGPAAAPQVLSAAPRRVAATPQAKTGTVSKAGIGAAAASERTISSSLSQRVDGIRRASADDVSGRKTLSALGNLFHGTKRRSAGLSVSARGLNILGRIGLKRFKAEASQEGRGEKIDSLPASSRKPRESLHRSFKVGVLAAVIGLLLQAVIPAVAAALGWEFNSNYEGPSTDMITGWLSGLRLFGAVTVMAPITEEVLFRGGILGGMMWLGSKLGKNKLVRMWLPAVLSSIIFVAVHETADPVLFATRMVGTLIMSYVFAREGLMASTAMHAAHNFVPALGLLGAAAFGPSGAALGSLTALLLSGGYAVYAHFSLKGDRADRKAGKIVPYKLTSKRALILSAIVVAGTMLFSLSPFAVILWGTSAVSLLLYGLIKRGRGPPAAASK